MSEEDYIIITNRVRVTNALSIFRECLYGDGRGIRKSDFIQVIDTLQMMEDELFFLIGEIESRKEFGMVTKEEEIRNKKGLDNKAETPEKKYSDN